MSAARGASLTALSGAQDRAVRAKWAGTPRRAHGRINRSHAA